jgi:hypothetical protein
MEDRMAKNGAEPAWLSELFKRNDAAIVTVVQSIRQTRQGGTRQTIASEQSEVQTVRHRA